MYQFRGSFEKYMLNHKATRFNLTRNFRSDDAIDNFAEFFQFYTQPSQRERSINSDKVVISLKSQ